MLTTELPPLVSDFVARNLPKGAPAHVRFTQVGEMATPVLGVRVAVLLHFDADGDTFEAVAQ